MSRSKNTHIREVWQDRLFHIFNQILFAIILFIVIYPLYFIVIASFSDPSAVLNGEVVFWPKDVSLIGYSAIMEYTRIWRGYMWSIIYTVVGTALSVTLTMLLAYALSCQFVGKKLVNWLVVFTMFFSGGLIPTFLTMKNLGLYNRPLIMILMGAISVWNTMIARTFIQTSLPQGLYEAAQIDGASHARYFFQMVLPLSSTIIAVLCVYYAVGRWNDYFTALIYVADRSKSPLQILAAADRASPDTGNAYHIRLRLRRGAGRRLRQRQRGAAHSQLGKVLLHNNLHRTGGSALHIPSGLLRKGRYDRLYKGLALFRRSCA